MIRKYSERLFVAFLLWGLVACHSSPEEQYFDREQQELASGQRYDSLFKGIHFNMEREQFMDYCFNMNLQHEFRQGGVRSSSWVECDLEGMNYPSAINFFPTFEDGAMTEMEAAIYYKAVTAGGPISQGDSLLADVIQLLETWYGGGFIKINSPYFYKEDVFAKVDGNRRITVFKDPSGHLINLWYVDLSKKKDGE